MPQIKEYRSQTSGPGVSSPVQITGTDISGGLGKSVQALTSGVDGVLEVVADRKRQQQDFESEKLISQEQLDLNEYLQNLKMKSPPGAEGFTEQAKQELDNRRQTLIDSASTDYMRRKIEMGVSRVHMGALNGAMQFEAESKAKKDRMDVEDISNRTRNAVRMNPATVNAALESMNSLIDATSLDGTTKAAWKQKELQELRQNEIRGWIDISPVKAKQMIEAGTWDTDLSSDLRESLANEADRGIRALEIENNRTKKLKDDESEARREAVKDDFIKKAVNGNLSANEVVMNNDLKSSEKEHILRQLKNNSLNLKAASNPAMFNQMVDDINRGKITSDDQILSKLGNGLTWSDVQHLRKELNSEGGGAVNTDKVFKKGLDDIAKGMLTKSNAMGLRDPEGDIQLQKWRIFAADEMAKGLASGLTVKQLTNPDDPNYVGKHLNKFTKTPEQIMRSVYNKYQSPANQVKPEDTVQVQAPARIEGESAAQYLERTKKK